MADPKMETGNTMLGAPPTLEWVAVGRLLVDPAYQRAIDGYQSRKIVYGMVKCWDWSLCQPLVVSRRSDGGMFIIDGQHRHAGAIERGDIPHLPCVVLAGCTDKDEATTFVALNTRRQKLSQADIFNGMLAAGDETARSTQELLAQTGWRVRRHSNTSSYHAGDLSCAPMLVRAIAQFGQPVVSNALVALREAYPDTPVTNAATLLKALIEIYRGDDLDGGDPDLFIETLGCCPPPRLGPARRRYAPPIARPDADRWHRSGNGRVVPLRRASPTEGLNHG